MNQFLKNHYCQECHFIILLVNIKIVYTSIINLLKKQQAILMQNRRQCQTSIPKVRRSIKDTTYQQPIDNKQILLNTSKILKGNKIKYRQHLRTQLLKRKYCHASQKFIKTNLSGAKNINQLLDDKFNQFQQSQKNNNQSYVLNPQNMIVDNIQGNRKSSSKHSRRGLKLFNQPLSQTKLNKIIFSHKQKQKQLIKTSNQKAIDSLKHSIGKSFKATSNYQNSFPQTQQTTFRQILQSKQLKRPVSPVNSIKFLNTSKIIKQNKQSEIKQAIKKYQSQNLDHRMNQYMNLLIHKTRKTKDIDIQKYIHKNNNEESLYQQYVKININNDQSQPIIHNRLSSTLNTTKGLYFKKMKNLKVKKQKLQLLKQLHNTLNLTSTNYTPQKQTFAGKSLKIQMKHMLKDVRTSLLVKRMLCKSINQPK